MLFDLRSRGRRNTIKVVYVTLALLLGGGLVLFGIGGDTSGGLVDAITGSNGGGNAGEERFVDRERRAAERTRANPRDAQAWADLTRARFQLAGVGERFDASTQTYTEAGRAKLRQASESWQRYLSLDPSTEQASQLAGIMAQAYSQAGLNQPEQGVRAQEIIAEARPGSNTYAQLAVAAYAAGQKRKGDLAKNEAIRRADPDDRENLRGQLEGAAQGGGTGTSATGG